MKANRQVIGLPLTLVLLQMPATATGTAKPVCSPPGDPAIGYEHAKFAPDADIRRQFRGFEVSFDSKDDDGELGTNLLRIPHWVAQEVRRWEPPEGARPMMTRGASTRGNGRSGSRTMTCSPRA